MKEGKQGLNEGRKEGLNEGRKEGLNEVIKILMKKGMINERKD